MQASEVDSHIKQQIQALKGTSRDDIWKRFQEGFKGYTIDTFKLAHRVTLRDLRNLLINHGVPVDTPRRDLSCADTLQACLEKKLPEEPTLLQKPQTANRAPLNSANQASPQPQYVQPRPQPPNPLGTLEDWMRMGLPVPPSLRPPNTDAYGRPLQQSQYVQPQASQRSVQYDDDDNWSWPSNKQEQQETSESHEQPDFSYEVNDDDEDDGQSEGEDWDDDGYSDDYGDNDYE